MPDTAAFTRSRTSSAVKGMPDSRRTWRMIRRSLVILNPFSCPGTWSPTVWCLCSESMRSLPRQRLYEDTGSNADTEQPGNDLQRILHIVVLTEENNESQSARSPQTRNCRSKADCARDVQLRDRHTGGTVRYESYECCQNRLEDRVTQEQTRQVLLPNAIDKQPNDCLLYTSDAADDLLCVDLGGRRIIKK